MIRLGLSPIHAGYALLLGSLVLLIASLYRLMRELGVPWPIAVPAIMAASGTAAASMAITMIRGDLFPAALNLAALSFVPRLFRSWSPDALNPQEPGSSARCTAISATIAGLLFGLAFLTKITTVFGVGATLLALLIARRWIAMFIVGAASMAVALGGLLLVQLASHGNFLLNLRSCASDGSMRWAITHFPMMFSLVAFTHDPVALALLVAGIAALAVAPPKFLTSLPGLLFITTGFVTLLLFLTPGIDKNHLLDIQLVCAVLVAACMCSGNILRMKLGYAMIGFLLIASLLRGWDELHADLSEHVAEYRNVWRTATADQHGPVLTDFTLLPVLANQRPYVLDDYMIPVLRLKYPAVWTDIYQKLDNQYFAAVILKADPTRDDRIFVWGKTFVAHLNGHYVFVKQDGNFLIYRKLPNP